MISHVGFMRSMCRTIYQELPGLGLLPMAYQRWPGRMKDVVCMYGVPMRESFPLIDTCITEYMTYNPDNPMISAVNVCHSGRISLRCVSLLVLVQ